MIIRRARDDERNALVELVIGFRACLVELRANTSVRSPAQAAAELDEYAAKAYPVFVAEDDEGRLVGYLVCRVDGKTVITIEALAKDDVLHPVQEAFLEQGAIQCGYCTGGMILAAVSLLEQNSDPSDLEILEAMDGNICRCNGYPKIVSAVLSAAEKMSR